MTGIHFPSARGLPPVPIDAIKRNELLSTQWSLSQTLYLTMTSRYTSYCTQCTWI